jgi:hypothetical protein
MIIVVFHDLRRNNNNNNSHHFLRLHNRDDTYASSTATVSRGGRWTIRTTTNTRDYYDDERLFVLQ